MANNEIGAFLNITPDVLKKLDSFDEKLSKIEQHAHTAADALTKGFDKVVGGTTRLEAAIKSLADKMDSFKTAGDAVRNIGKEMGKTGQSASQMANSTNSAVVSLTGIADIANRLQSSRPFENWNIARLKAQIAELNAALNQGTSVIFSGRTLTQQETVDLRNYLQDALKMQETSTTAKLTTLAKVSKARNADAEAQRKLDEKNLQEHLRGLEERSKREREVNAELLRLGTERLNADKKNILETQKAKEKNKQDLTSQYEAEIKQAKSVEEANNRKMASDLQWYEQRAKQREKDLVSQQEALRKEQIAEANAQARLRPTEAQSDNAAMKRVNAERKTQEDINKERQKGIEAAQALQKQEAALEEKRAKERLAAERRVDKEIATERKQSERQMAAEILAIQKNNIKKEQLLRQQEQARLSTMEGALEYSNNIKRVYQHAEAIQYLRKARGNLLLDDKNYESNLNRINQAIDRHNKELQKAGIQSQGLAQKQRNLMDTIGQLQRQFALLFSVSQIEGYISKLANIRGEFELQQRSLQAILQNKAQADEIFNKTVELAVKSPFQIKQLVSYVKQLAAYRIEGDKLYDTTKRLADVSAGLGVDMQRLILAYGQVKAAAYLRGTEVRQFTEAGINMYGELQAYFKEVKNEAYTTAQIVDMISKRKVTFEDVEKVFERLTNKGGIFYNMQEIQAETLQGKISNLKDSIDIMLNSIGKANEATLKGAIDSAKLLIDNWENVVAIGGSLIGILALLGTHALQTGSSIKAVFTTNMAANAAKTLKTTELLKVGFRSLSVAVNTFSANLKAAFLTNLPALGIIAGVVAITDAFSRLQNRAEAILDVFKEIGEKKQSLLQIADAYNKVRIASEKAKEGEIANAEEVTKKKREQIAKLEELYSRNGLELEVKLQDVPQSELNEYFDKLYKGYENYLRLQESLKLALVENNGRIEGWFSVFGDNIDADSKQLTNAYNNVISKTREVGAAVSLLTNYYDNLTEAQKEQYKQQAQGLTEAMIARDGESQIDYLERQINAVNDFSEAIGATLDKSVIKAREYSRDFRLAFIGSKGTSGYKGTLREFDNELDDILRRIKSRYSDSDWDINGKVYLEAVLNTELASQGWESWKIEHAKDYWGITPKVNVEEAVKEMDGLDKIFTQWFNSHSYTLNIEYGDLGDKEIGKGIIEQGDKMAAAYKNATLVVERLKRSMDATFNQKQSELSADLWARYFGDATEVSKKELIQAYEDIAKLNKQAAIDAGWTEVVKTRSTAERNIWSERISVLKEMQARYEKLNKLIGDTRAISETRSAFLGALKSAKMDEIIKAEDILPTKEGIINVLEKLLEKMPEDAKHIAMKTGLNKEIAELKIGIQQDYLKDQLEKTKENIDAMFNQIDLHKRLKDSGLTEAEVQQLFPGLASNLDDVRKATVEAYKKSFPGGEYLIEDTEAYKQYRSDMDKLDKRQIKQEQDLIIELTKAYKTQLTDQLQLDRWYYEERAKIQKANLTEEQKVQYEANLKREYQAKTDSNTWKEFQSSDLYISLFENIESSSTRMLAVVRDKLASLREELKYLPADQLKAIINQQEKIDEMISKRNPFKDLTEGVKTYIQFLKQREQLEQKYINSLKVTSVYDEQKKKQSQIIEQKRAEYNTAVETYGVNSSQANALKIQLETEQSKLNVILEQLEAEGKITKETSDQIKNGQLLGKELSSKFAEIGGYFSQFSSEIVNITGDMENIFGTLSDGAHDLIDTISGVAGGLGQVANGISSFLSKDKIGGAVGILGGLVKSIGSLFSIRDKRKERDIQKQIKNIELLGQKYDELKEKMDNAWNSATLHETTQNTINNLDKQINDYKELIKTEQSKKKADEERIEEWKNTIKELEDTKQEILKQEQMELGAIGTDSEYKSAAEEFVQAWMDAFKETGEGIDGLKESFDEMIDNLVIKQATMRLAQNRLAKLFDAIDKSVTEESFGGISLTRNELDNIKSIGESAIAGLNEDLKALMETLGIQGGSQTAELSALTQSIQGLSEATAEELAALLGSIRFFVALQTSDVTAIKNLLEARYALESQEENTNPMLVELRAQTNYLEVISDRIDRVFATSSNSKGAGLRVFIG